MRQLEPASSPALPTQMAIAKVAVRTSEIVHGGDGDAGAAGAVASNRIKPRMSGLVQPRMAATARPRSRSSASPRRRRP
jgi:hypothetical protein